MGFHPAWKCEEVVELIFDKGMLQDEYDRPKRIARIRERILKVAKRGDGKDRRTIKEIWDFVESSFDRKYRWWGCRHRRSIQLTSSPPGLCGQICGILFSMISFHSHLKGKG